MKINDRIAKIREVFCQGNNRIFAERLGKSEGVASSLCNKASIGLKTIDDIAKAFPMVSRDWLVNGNGDMYTQVTQNNVNGDNLSGCSVKHVELSQQLVETNRSQQLVIERQQDTIDRLIALLEGKQR